MTLTGVLDRLRKRAEADPALNETLQHLADADPVKEPFDIPHDDVAQLARTINRQRPLRAWESVEPAASITR